MGIMANKKKPVPAYGPIREALETTIGELEAAGRLGHVDAARIAMARTLAATLDESPLSPALWREYRQVEEALRKENDAQRDPFDDLLASLSAEVRHEEKPKKAKPRP